MDAHLIEELGCRHRAAVVTQQRFALGIEWFEAVLAVAAAAEAKAAAQLAFEDVKEGAASVSAGAALGLGEDPLQQPVLAQLEDLLSGLIALAGNGGDLLGGGLLHLTFAQFHLLLEHLLLAFGLLQAGVLLGVDLGEAVELLPQGADFFFELVALAAFGAQGFSEAAVVGRRRGSGGRFPFGSDTGSGVNAGARWYAAGASRTIAAALSLSGSGLGALVWGVVVYLACSAASSLLSAA